MLSDQDKRALYDKYGHAAFEDGGGDSDAAEGFTVDPGDIFRAFFGDGFSGGDGSDGMNPLEAMFGGGGSFTFVQEFEGSDEDGFSNDSSEAGGFRRGGRGSGRGWRGGGGGRDSSKPFQFRGGAGGGESGPAECARRRAPCCTRRRAGAPRPGRRGRPLRPGVRASRRSARSAPHTGKGAPPYLYHSGMAEGLVGGELPIVVFYYTVTDHSSYLPPSSSGYRYWTMVAAGTVVQPFIRAVMAWRSCTVVQSLTKPNHLWVREPRRGHCDRALRYSLSRRLP